MICNGTWPLKFSRDLESDWTIKNEEPHFGIKEHAAVDAKHGFILATIHSPASVHDTNFLQYCTVFSRHTNQSIKKVYADKGYAGLPNRNFLSENKIADGIMRKDSTTAKFTLLNMFGEHLLHNLTGQAEREIERVKKIFTPLNHVWNLFIRGPRYTKSSAQLNTVPFGKFNRVKAVFWDQPSSRQSQTSTIYNHHEKQL